MYCVGRATCVLFLEDSLVAFGTPDSLKIMLLARQGVLTRLSTNAEAVRLLETGDKTAPVRGIILGAQLQSALSSSLGQWFGKSAQSIKLPVTVIEIGYHVMFGTRVHLEATLQCTSNAAAALLAQTLNALSSLQSMTAPAVGDGFALNRAKAWSVGSSLHLEASGQAPDAGSK